uniref:Uncharacterized protein n=1 Tax=Aegilops tauschii TaxID=37682 RepID=M8AVQ9_AEGTA
MVLAVKGQEIQSEISVMHSWKLKVIKVSNVVGINPKPFDPETYMEEDDFITDESKGKKSVHTDVVRCRRAKNADGTESGLLQSQGRLLQKMRIMPPESSSRSHSSLTAPVDSQNEKTIKVQTWYDKKYPERMKQERERAEEKNIQARSILRKKKEKVNHKYTQSHKGKQKLTSGFFDEALDEDEAPSSWYNPHGRVAHSGFEHNLEFEALAQRRIINAKVHEYSDSESEELEYGTEFKDIESSPRHEREYELDENNVYDKDLDVSSLPNEEIEADVTKTSINVGRVHLFPECNKCCRVSALSKPHPHRAPAASTEWASKSQVFNGLFYSAIAQNASDIIIHVIMSPTEHVLCVNLSANTSHANTLSFIVHFNRQIQGPEHKRGPRKGRVIDFGEELYPPKKRFLNRWRRQLLLTAMMSEKNCQHQTEQSKRY